MIISGETILFIMRTALAYPFEDDEVPVVSIEVLDATVTALRVEVTDLKADFKEHRKEFAAAIARLDTDIKSAVSELRIEIRSMAAKAEGDLKEFAGRVEQQLREMRADYTRLSEKVDTNYATLSAKIDKSHEMISANNEKLTQLSSKVNALFWVIGIAVAATMFFITVGKTFHWF